MNKNKFLFAFSINLLLSSVSTFNAMMEMAVMMGAQQGASVANQAVSEMFQNMGASIAIDQSELDSSLSLFSAEVSKAKDNQTNILSSVFTSSIKHVGKQENTQSLYVQEMQNYIFKAISLHKPPLYYLISPQSVAITLDQAFVNGTMYTPQGATWKNVFQYGDWEYDYASDSFYQFKNVDLFSKETDSTTGAVVKSSSKAAFNSIFTEFYTYATSYEIQAEITLYKIQYPFFVGVQFNKTRWISGNADSLTKSRLIGIYASSATDIGIYYAEQKTVANQSKSLENSVEVLYPLEQIVKKTVPLQAALVPNLFAGITQQPITFSLKIITSPGKIEYKIWQKSNPEPKKFAAINSSQKDLYLYHGIGFMSPGAIAQFKLLKPTRLLFSQNNLSNFAQEVEALVSQE